MDGVLSCRSTFFFVFHIYLMVLKDPRPISFTVVKIV